MKHVPRELLAPVAFLVLLGWSCFVLLRREDSTRVGADLDGAHVEGFAVREPAPVRPTPVPDRQRSKAPAEAIEPRGAREAEPSVEEANAFLHGWVCDEAGRPVPGAVVALTWAGEAAGEDHRLQVIADGIGVYRFRRAPDPGARATLQASRGDREGTLRSDPRPVAADERAVRLVVRRPGIVDGTVRLSPERRGSSVEVFLLDAHGTRVRRTRLVRGAPGADTHRFELIDVEPGPYDLELRDATRGATALRISGVVVRSGAREGDVRLDGIELGVPR